MKNEMVIEVHSPIIDLGFGVSGHRPGLEELKGLVKNRSIDFLYVYDLSRLDRNVTEVFELLQALKESGVEVKTVGGGVTRGILRFYTLIISGGNCIHKLYAPKQQFNTALWRPTRIISGKLRSSIGFSRRITPGISHPITCLININFRDAEHWPIIELTQQYLQQQYPELPKANQQFLLEVLATPFQDPFLFHRHHDILCSADFKKIVGQAYT